MQYIVATVNFLLVIFELSIIWDVNPQSHLQTHFILKRLIFYAIWIFQYKKTVVFCSFRIEVQTLQISGKELFVYVKLKKKINITIPTTLPMFWQHFFHNYAHLYKCTSYNILILIPSLQKSRLFVVCFCFFVYDCWKSYWLLLLESIYSKPEGNHYGIFISTNIELTTETVCM